MSGFTDLGKGLTVNVGVIAGGTRSNVVAAKCLAEVDVRIAKAKDAAWAERMFRGLKVTDKACRLAVTGGINRPPMERKAGTVALFRLAERLAGEMGLELRGGCDWGWVGWKLHGGYGGADVGWDGRGGSWGPTRHMSMWW